MTLDEALSDLRAAGNPERAAGSAAYHKVEREYLGVAVPQIDEMAKWWRAGISLEERLALAKGLWDSNLFEARIAAAKLLVQARIRPDDEAAWRLIASWVPDFDCWALADHASIAGQKRIVADPTRLDEVETWTTSPHMWTRRAALVMTLPWNRMRNPKPEDLERRERILGWAASYVDDREWFIQKAIGWWLRDLSKHDPERTRAFIAAHGERMKPFARKEAMRHLGG